MTLLLIVAMCECVFAGSQPHRVMYKNENGSLGLLVPLPPPETLYRNSLSSIFLCVIIYDANEVELCLRAVYTDTRRNVWSEKEITDRLRHKPPQVRHGCFVDRPHHLRGDRYCLGGITTVLLEAQGTAIPKLVVCERVLIAEVFAGENQYLLGYRHTNLLFDA